MITGYAWQPPELAVLKQNNKTMNREDDKIYRDFKSSREKTRKLVNTNAN